MYLSGVHMAVSVSKGPLWRLDSIADGYIVGDFVIKAWWLDQMCLVQNATDNT